jgi:glycosyltransferase involved in cell wall biosynthesis
LTRDLALRDRVVFLGLLTGREKVRLLKGCEFYVCSAIAEEPFSNSTLEAFAAGKTVIASCIGGIPDVVKDGVNGLLVNPGDAGLLAEKIVALINDRELIRRLSLNSHVTARAYDTAVVMEKYLRLYEQIIPG